MARQIQITFDAAAPRALAEFWCHVLGYVEQPPPPGFDTWEDGRQKTEAMQRQRVVALLAGAGMTDAERERFVQQGRALSVFEAEVLAGVAGAATEPRFAKAH